MVRPILRQQWRRHELRLRLLRAVHDDSTWGRRLVCAESVERGIWPRKNRSGSRGKVGRDWCAKSSANAHAEAKKIEDPTTLWMARGCPMTIPAIPASRHFPIAAGIFFGLGLGGFFDGIVLHQVLQWHHMLSSWFPVNTIENLELNTRWDGIFHSTTYLFVLIGLFLLWRTAHRRHLYWSSKLLIGTMLLGFGSFNTVEGIIDHHLIGIHHVNETVPREYWPIWDIAFTLWGAGMIIIGWMVMRAGQREMSQ
jgi:uncharacterized membrane protein